MPYDQFCYQLLTGSGSNMANPAASYFKILRDPGQAMENTTHLFLAIRFNCNKCHDHPFERWTQDQYYTLSSYFAQVSRTEDPKFKGQKTQGTAVQGALPLVEIDTRRQDRRRQKRTHGPVAEPKFPFEHSDMPDAHASRREQLARWIAAKDNPYFAKSYVNRVWSYLLGVGIIEPIDDIRAGNPPTNPQLLDRLASEFIESDFNVQELIKTICKSRTYQHAITTNKWNADDEINYSHAIARRLPAEVLFDAIHRAAGSQSRLPGLPAGARAVQLVDSNVPVSGSFLELFGKPPRESACECERSNTMLLGPVLNLVNGPGAGDSPGRTRTTASPNFWHPRRRRQTGRRTLPGNLVPAAHAARNSNGPRLLARDRGGFRAAAKRESPPQSSFGRAMKRNCRPCKLPGSKACLARRSGLCWSPRR